MESRQVGLSHLSEEECKQILSVIKRDFNLRQQEQQRIEELESEIEQEKLRSEILSKGRAFNDNCCVRCFAQFYVLFNPKVQCTVCKYNVCKKCSVHRSKDKKHLCSLCTKQEEIEVLSNKWFYSNVAERFDRFGSANVVQMIHKKKESNADSDSASPLTDAGATGPQNKQPSSSAISSPLDMQQIMKAPAFTKIDRRDDILEKFRDRLDVIEKSIKQLHLQENSEESRLQNQSYQSSLNQNMTNIKDLLTSVGRQLASNQTAGSDSSFGELMNREQQDAIAKQLLKETVHQLYPSSPFERNANNTGDQFSCIEPSALTLETYSKRLSEAIVNKINEDLQSFDINNRDGEKRSENSNSGIEDVRVNADGTSDVDTEEKAKEAKTDLHAEYNFEDYEVTPDTLSDIVARKREFFTLPGLDDGRSSISRSSDLDLDLTGGHRSDHLFGTWSFSPVPMTLRSGFRKNKQLSNGSSDSSPEISLQCRYPPRGPTLGNRNAYEISEVDSASYGDDDSDLDLDEEQRKELWFTESVKHYRIGNDGERKKTQPQDSYAQTDETLQIPREQGTRSSNIGMLRRNQMDSGVQTFEDDASLDGAGSEGVDFPDVGEDLKPRFSSSPQDLIVSLGQSFQSRACLTGKKPIDVYWFHDTSRLDFDERCTVTHKGGVYSLDMVDVRVSDGGHYVCIGVNEHGRCSRSFHISVIDPETTLQSTKSRIERVSAKPRN